jgi:hypothetical protein
MSSEYQPLLSHTIPGDIRMQVEDGKEDINELLKCNNDQIKENLQNKIFSNKQNVVVIKEKLKPLKKDFKKRLKKQQKIQKACTALKWTGFLSGIAVGLSTTITAIMPFSNCADKAFSTPQFNESYYEKCAALEGVYKHRCIQEIIRKLCGTKTLPATFEILFPSLGYMAGGFMLAYKMHSIEKKCDQNIKTLEEKLQKIQEAKNYINEEMQKTWLAGRN